MLFPCEMIVKKILPAFRAYLVKQLYEKYKMKQNDIAKCLGITQPSVSLYLSGERGGFEDIFKSDEVAKKINVLDELSEKLVNKKLSEQELMQDMCHLCSLLRKLGAYCKVHGELDKNRVVPCGLCDVCFGDKEIPDL
ncbi:MAG: transcriptional regulator [Candidatus Helarchaeota archaeon]|nr:transcriptional regulator [Candidatus Helarchaeota archaeon]